MIESFRLQLSREAPEYVQTESGSSKLEQEGSLLGKLDRRIEEHKSHNSEKGLIARGIAGAYRAVEMTVTGSNSDERSLEELQKLRAQALAAKDDPSALANLKIDEAIKKDSDAFHWQDEVSHYGSAFVKAVPLFMTRGKGVYLSAALHGADQVRTATGLPLAAVDFTLGATKGVLLKKGLDRFGASEAAVWKKGMALGGGMSMVDAALTSSTWYDHGSRQWHMKDGAIATAGGTLMGAGTGAVVFPLGHSIFEKIGASRFGRNALAKSPLLKNLANGWSFGLASGTTGETIRQIQAGEQVDPLKIATRGVVQSFVDMGAAGAGYKLSSIREGGRVNFQWSPKDGSEIGSSAREFKVVGGKKALDEALAKVDGEGAMIKVRERLAAGTGWRRLLGMQTYGEAVDMFVQHLPNGRKLNPDATQARLIAACNLDGSLAGKGVIAGKDVFMQAGTNRLRFTSEAPAETSPEMPVMKLGDPGPQTPGLKPGSEMARLVEQNAEKLQYLEGVDNFKQLTADQQLDVKLAILLREAAPDLAKAGEAAEVKVVEDSYEGLRNIQLKLIGNGFTPVRAQRIVNMIRMHDLLAGEFSAESLNSLAVQFRVQTEQSKLEAMACALMQSGSGRFGELTPDVVRQRMEQVRQRANELTRNAIPIVTTAVEPGYGLRELPADAVFTVHTSVPDAALGRNTVAESFVDHLAEMESPEYSMSTSVVTSAHKSFYLFGGRKPGVVAVVAAPPENVSQASNGDIASRTRHDVNWNAHVSDVEWTASQGSPARQLLFVMGLPEPVIRQFDAGMRDAWNKVAPHETAQQARQDSQSAEALANVVKLITNRGSRPLHGHNEAKVNNPMLVGFGIRPSKYVVFEDMQPADLSTLLKGRPQPEWLFTEQPFRAFGEEVIVIPKSVWSLAAARDIPFFIF